MFFGFPMFSPTPPLPFQQNTELLQGPHAQGGREAGGAHRHGILSCGFCKGLHLLGTRLVGSVKKNKKPLVSSVKKQKNHW